MTDLKKFRELHDEFETIKAQREQYLSEYGFKVSALKADKLAIEKDINSLRLSINDLMVEESGVQDLIKRSRKQIIVDIENAKNEAIKIINEANDSANKTLKQAKDELSAALRSRYDADVINDDAKKRNNSIRQELEAAQKARISAEDKEREVYTRLRSVEARENSVKLLADAISMREKKVSSDAEAVDIARADIEAKSDENVHRSKSLEVLINKNKHLYAEMESKIKDFEVERDLFNAEKDKSLIALKKQKDNNTIREREIADIIARNKKEQAEIRAEKARLLCQK